MREPGEGAQSGRLLALRIMSSDLGFANGAASGRTAIKVAIVDDHHEIRASLSGLIRRDPGIVLQGEYANGEAAVRHLPANCPDVVLMDINLPGMNGVECVRQLKAQVPQVQFLMLTVYEDSDSLFNSFQAGASGYLLKRTAAARLLEAIHEVYQGGSPLTPQMARRLVQFFSTPRGLGTAQPLPELTPNEHAFLGQLARGFTYKEIAAAMNLSIDSVRGYVRAVYEKLHVHSRTEAVVKYLQAGSRY